MSDARPYMKQGTAAHAWLEEQREARARHVRLATKLRKAAAEGPEAHAEALGAAAEELNAPS